VWLIISVWTDENNNGMASVRSTHHNIHAPPAASSSQQVVIDLNAVDVGGALPPPGSEDGTVPQSTARNTNVGAALPSLRTLIKPLEGSLPFIVIVLVKVLYDHRLGKLLFYMITD